MSDKNTIITSYGESCQILDYTTGYCGCCFSNFFNEWYDKNEAYFVRKGIFVIDELMFLDCEKGEGVEGEKKERKKVRYCFKFDFTDADVSYFSILNYYNREKVADFHFKKSDFPNLHDVVCTFDFIDLKAFSRLGYFLNDWITKKLDKSWDVFYKRTASLPNHKLNEYYEKQQTTDRKMLLQFMCDHSVQIILSTMCYYTKEKPERISYESFAITEDLEYTTKKQKYSYKYTGYINLNDTKIYRTIIKKNLDEEKKKEYQRHIESWSVRGHYRTIKGKRVWVKEYIKGEGILENRIYGTKPESEVLLIPKVIECEREVRVSTKEIGIPKDVLIYDEQPIPKISAPTPIIISQSEQPPKTIIARKSVWQKIRLFLIKLFKRNGEVA